MDSNKFTYRNATVKDLDVIMSIIADAQAYLASLNINQWQDGYPTEAKILEDIAFNESYLVIEDGDIMATSVLSFRPEPTYSSIDGTWHTGNVKYGVIHRLAMRATHRGRGRAYSIMEHFHELAKQNGCESMRIDTHRHNLGMQKLIESLGYKYCGVIILESGAERLAYELVF